MSAAPKRLIESNKLRSSGLYLVSKPVHIKTKHVHVI